MLQVNFKSWCDESQRGIKDLVRLVLTYKLGWIMLWNFPSFSFLEIGNIKLLFEIGLWTEFEFSENYQYSQHPFSEYTKHCQSVCLTKAKVFERWLKESIGHPNFINWHFVVLFGILCVLVLVGTCWYFLVYCAMFWYFLMLDPCWPEESIRHPHLASLSHCQVPD